MALRIECTRINWSTSSPRSPTATTYSCPRSSPSAPRPLETYPRTPLPKTTTKNGSCLRTILKTMNLSPIRWIVQAPLLVLRIVHNRHFEPCYWMHRLFALTSLSSRLPAIGASINPITSYVHLCPLCNRITSLIFSSRFPCFHLSHYTVRLCPLRIHSAPYRFLL